MPIAANLVNKVGTIANAAAAATVLTTTVDLGNNYKAGVAWVSKRGVASDGEVLSLEFSTNNTTWYPMVNYQLNGPAINSVSAVNMDIGGRVQARYLRGKFVNGATVQSSTAFLSVYVQPEDS